MGSFTEVVMSFPFRDDTPIEVLSAFASVRRDQPPEVRARFEAMAQEAERQRAMGLTAPSMPIPPAPKLPPVEDEDEWWDPTDPDADMAVPWAHDWGAWLSEGMAGFYIQSQTGAVLQWTIGGMWVLTCRATLKAYPAELIPNLVWMGRYIGAGNEEQPFLVGYLKHEYENRPWLAWSRGSGPLDFENLNVARDHGLTDDDTSQLRSHMWRRNRDGNLRIAEAQLRQAQPGSRAAEMIAPQVEQLRAMPAEPPDDWVVPLESILAYRDQVWKAAVITESTA